MVDDATGDTYATTIENNAAANATATSSTHGIATISGIGASPLAKLPNSKSPAATMLVSDAKRGTHHPIPPPSSSSSSYLPPNSSTSPSATRPQGGNFLSVSQVVRQSSDTTNNRSRGGLTRSLAVCSDDERPGSSEAGAGSDGTESEVDGSTHNAMPFLSPYLRRPTKLVTIVDQQHYNEKNYIQLNQYRLIEEIGQGSYGIVKLAYNEQDKNLYAMKVLDKLKLLKNFACFRPPPRRANKAAPRTHQNPLQLVQREIAILKKLSHPNVVKLVEVLDDPSDNFLYMVFEYVEKRSLMDLPTENPLDEHTSWKYFRDTLKGLEYLHYQKIVHRDIKPSNLLLSETEQVKIADFGVSCEFEGIDAFLTGTAGTPAFMAPEALTEDSSQFYSGRAQDIWSLGITLYALVYGNVPFWDAYVIALHKRIKTESITLPEEPHISELLKNLILGMLRKDPGHRLLLAEIKDHPWVTRCGTRPMPSEDDNCHLVTVTEEEIENCVRVIPRLDTLILVKAMGHRKRFGNPFRSNRAACQSLKFRRKSSSLRDPIYIPSTSSARISTEMEEYENEEDSSGGGGGLGLNWPLQPGQKGFDKYELIALSFVEMCVRIAGLKWGRERRRELAKMKEELNYRKMSKRAATAIGGLGASTASTSGSSSSQCPTTSALVKGFEAMRFVDGNDEAESAGGKLEDRPEVVNGYGGGDTE